MRTYIDDVLLEVAVGTLFVVSDLNAIYKLVKCLENKQDSR